MKFFHNFYLIVTEHFNKGVRSDFVRLFQITKNEHVYALGFVFSFTEDPLNQLISVSCSDSYKDIKRFSKSVAFNVSDFKNKMNEVKSRDSESVLLIDKIL